MLRKALSIVVSTLFFYALPSQAQDHIEFGAGAFGFANGNFMDKPSGADFDELGPYPGFAGAGGGGGLAFSALWRGIVGLELQFMHSAESGEGTVDVSGTAIDVKIEQTSLHIPLLLKLQAPTESVRPFLVVGPDFVSPSDTEMSSRYPIFSASSESYTALAFGFGLDFRLGIEGHDLRIPFMLRGNYNSGAGSKTSERGEWLSNGTQYTGITYYGDWQWQAFATLGLSYYFHSAL